MSDPRMNGVTFFTTIELVGRFPVKTLCGNSWFSCSPDSPDWESSCLAWTTRNTTTIFKYKK